MEKNRLFTTLIFLAFFFFSRMPSASELTSTVTVLGFIYSVNVSVTSSSARIDWMTLENATGLVEYGLSSSYGLNESSAAYATNHSIIITGLSPATLYHYRIWSCINQTTCFNTSDANFTTQPVSTTPTPGAAGAVTGGGGYGPAFGMVYANATPTPTPSSTPVPTPYPLQTYFITKTMGEQVFRIMVSRRLMVHEEFLSPTGFLSTVTLFVKNIGATRIDNFEVREKIPTIIGVPTEFQYPIPPTLIEGDELVWRIGYLDAGDAVAFNYVTTKMIPSSYMLAYWEPVIKLVIKPLPSPTPLPTPLPSVQEKKLGFQDMVDAYALPVGISLIAIALILIGACWHRKQRAKPESEKIERILEKVRAYRKQRTGSKQIKKP